MEIGVPGVIGLNVQNFVMEEIDRGPENVTTQLLLTVVKNAKVWRNKKNSAIVNHVPTSRFLYLVSTVVTI